MAADQRRSMGWARWSAALIILGVGAAAFRLSFTTLQDLAVLARVPARDAWLFPLIVDGTILLATFGVLVSPGRSERRFFLSVLVIGAAVSVAGNSVHAVASGHPLPGWAAAIVAAVAPISLLADTHGLALLFRAAQRDPQPVEVVEPVSIAVDPVSADPVPETTPVPVSVSVPEPSAEPEPARPSRKPRTDPVAVARAVELHRQGKKYAEIARELGVSARTAAKYAKTAGGTDSVDNETVPAPELASPAPEPAPAPVAVPPRVVAPVVPVQVAAPVRSVRPVQTMLPVAVPAGSY